MRDLKQLIAELSGRQVTRKQFLTIVGGSFVGMVGFLSFLQANSTPEQLATSEKGVFGEREYGHEESAKKAAQGGFSEDVFG